MNNYESAIVDPTDFSLYQPPIVKNEVYREALVETIEEYFNDDVKFVYVSGEPGIGKTTLLSQFSSKNKSKSFILYIDQDNKFSLNYDSIIKDFYIQISVFLGDNYSTGDTVDEGMLAAKISSLQYSVQKNRKNIYFVLDGIDGLSDDDFILEKITRLLPISCPSIKYIISISSKKIPSLIKHKNSKEFRIPLLSTDEAIAMLPKFDREHTRQFLTSFKKVPSSIVNLRRLVESGADIDGVLQQVYDNKDSMHEAEWLSNLERVESSHEELALLAYSEGIMSISALEKILKTNSFIEKLNSMSFITQDADGFRFVSNDSKHFVRNKLKKYKESSIDKIVNYLSKNSDESLTKISSVFHSYERYPEVINALNNENIAISLEKSKSITELMRQINLGCKASEVIESEPEMLRFSQMKNIVWRIESSTILKSELHAHLVADDIQLAIELAVTASSNEEKLQLLSIIVKHQTDKGRSKDEKIIEQMEFLYGGIDPEIIGVEKTLAIALELFPVMPERSLDLINKIDPLGHGGENSSDYAFLRFSLSAFINNNGSLEFLDENIKSISEEKRKVINALKLFKRGTPATAILNGIKDDKKPGDEIFILRNWINAFPESADNSLLINRVISLAISTTNFSANSNFYCDMANALIHVKDDAVTKELYQKIITQLPSAKRLGPTPDYVELNLLIYKIEKKLGIVGSRLNETYQECINLDDKATSLIALSHVHNFIVKEDIKRFGFDIKAKKEKIFSEIISDTADHFIILKEALKIEAEIDFKNAILWAESLNIRSRRCEALQLVISEACERSEGLDIDNLCQHAKNIYRENLRKIAFNSILAFCNEQKFITENNYRRLIKLRNSFSSIKYACMVDVRLLEIIKKQSFYNEDHSTKQKELILKNWNDLDGEWQKIDVGFNIHNKLQTIDAEFAKTIKNKSIELRKEGHIYNEDTASALLDTVDLAVRAYYHLIKEGAETDDMTNRLVSTITELPSDIFRCRELSRLCSAFQLCNKHTKVASLIERNIFIILDRLNKNSDAYKGCLYWAAPILARYSIPLLSEYLKHLDNDKDFQDVCIQVCIQYFYNGVLIGDPFDPIKMFTPDISLKDATDIISLLKLTNSCLMTYYLLTKYSSVISKKIKEHKFSQPQYNLLIADIESLIKEKISGSNFINHEGFNICSNALVFQLKQKKDVASWTQLILEARKVPNKSDSAFVLSTIAEIMPASMKQLKLTLFKESLMLTSSLPSDLDKLGRYQDLYEKSRLIDKPFAKDCLKKAISISASSDSEEYEKRRSSLIDISYSLDKEFTEALSSMADTDPAKRECIEANVKRKFEEISYDKKFNSEDPSESITDNKKKFPKISWEHLAKLNAGNLKVSKRVNYVKYLSELVNYEPQEMYPLLSYYITVVAMKAKGNENCRKYLTPIFSALMKNIDLFSSVYKIGNLRHEFADYNSDETGNLVVNINERGKAVEYIKKWISNNEIKEFIIYEPYFHIEDLSFIGDVIDKDPNFNIKIFTVGSMKEKMLKSSCNEIEDVISDY